MTDFTWKIGGPAGFGIMTTGLIFSKAFMRYGYYVFDYAEYPSLIRGGRNTYQCRVSSEEVHSQNKPVHILIALNRETIEVNRGEVTDDGVIVYDSDKIKNEVAKGFGIPLARLARENGGEELMANNVALGASMKLLGCGLETLNSVIKDVFSGKGNDTVTANMKSAKAGYDYTAENYEGKSEINAKKLDYKKKYLMTGNEAIGAGAIMAGCKFYAAYPMTPASTILSYMSSHQNKFDFVAKQCHDEISTINTAIGAAFAGVRAMVATAGGGFALMAEGYGMAAMTETPLVIVIGQRPGPATGLPTWTSQADLRFVLHAHQDDFPRIVIIPGDVEEAYRTTQEAHNTAEKYQTPVIILTDKFLGESHKTVEKLESLPIQRGELTEKFDGEYKRYTLTPSGISPRLLPGTKGAIVVANSDEHSESGQSTEESSMRNAMMEKRMRKLEMLKKEMPAPKLYGEKKADITIVCHGSVKGPAMEALKLLKSEGTSANVMHFVYVSPFPKDAEKMLRDCRKLMVAENNYTAQFAGLIREYTGIEIKEKLLKFDGRPFYPEEIAEKVRKLK